MGPDRRNVFSWVAGAGLAARSTQAAARDNQFQPIASPPQQLSVKEGYVDVEGARLYYWDTGGNGLPLLLAHAGTGSAFLWAYQQPVFAAAGYRVIAFSRRGYAGTHILDRKVPYNVLDDIEALADQLGLHRFHGLGTAAGGGIMLDYAIKRPTRLLSLIVASAIGNIGDPAYRAIGASLRPRQVLDLPIEIQELGPCYRALNPEGVAQWLELVKQAGASLAETPKRIPINWTDVGSLTMPVLWMTGDADMFIPPPLLALFHRSTPGSEFQVVDGSGHSIYWERPAEFNAKVLGFLKQHG